MSDRSARGSSRGSQPFPLEKRAYPQPESNNTKEGYLDPYYSTSAHRAKNAASSSIYSSDQSSRSSSKSAKKPVTPAVIHHDPDAPKDKDRYNKTTDARYYENSYLDSSQPKNKDSMKKAFDPRYYQNSSYYKD